LKRLALLLMVLVVVGCANRHDPAISGFYEIQHATTQDGVRIALHHYNAAEGAVSTDRPVVVCHGICSNRYSFLSNPHGGLLGALVEQGRDVWAIELRGHGRSDRPGKTDGMKFDWDLDDYALQDLPAAVDFVMSRTDADGVDYIGHSMGGMVAYIALSRGELEQVRSLVIVASPVSLHQSSKWIGGLFELESLLRRMKKLPVRSGAKLGTILPADHDFVVKTLYNPENTTRAESRQLLLNGVNDLGLVEAEQWLQMKKRGYLTDAGGELNYVEMMGAITVPALVLAGSVDETAMPHQVRMGYEALGSPDKEYYVVGRANGAGSDYGHMDLVNGSNADTDVYPVIIRWLDAHR